jgi:iron complex outermembrane recepter protein
MSAGAKKRWKIRPRAIAVALFTAPIAVVRAQHASDDPIASATDAFGLTLGLETIGLYGPGYVRGFNPQIAGNVRIEGLYFDQQGALSNRVVDGSTIRVGVSEVGYAFPSPTGIMDYDLRSTGNGTPSATVVASVGPFQARGGSIDAVVPFSNELRVPIGASYGVSTQTPPSPNPGYTSDIANFGATPEWRPNEWLTVRGIFDWTETSHALTLPSVVMGGDYLPPQTPRGYYGQNWAQARNLSENYGGIVTARLSGTWSLAAGVFRSISDNPVSYTDLFLNTQPDGMATHVMVGYPDQRAASTSGEARLTGHFATDAWRQDLIFLARGRDTLALYGGSDLVSLGPAAIDQATQVSQPVFSFSTRTHDRTEIGSAGVAYRVQWQARADLAVGLQQEDYSKEVASPAVPVAHLSDRPLRAYGTFAFALNERATAYAGYTQGLEDSGIAASSAENRGAILPDARTWQTDAGIRYLISPSVKVIAGVFEIEKPYFNIDLDNVDRKLGLQKASGFEWSLSGEIVKDLNVTAAVLWGNFKVIGADLGAEHIGSVALNQARVTATLNASYKLPMLPKVSADITVLHFGPYPASIDNEVQAPGETIIVLGARYRFRVFGAAATLRAEVQNLANTYFWNLTSSPEFSQFQPRAYFAYLTADF